MSSSIITVCTRIHTVIRKNRHTYIHARAQVTSLTDLPETHCIEEEARTMGSTERRKLTFRRSRRHNDRLDTKKSKSINYMLWCKQFFECRVATNTSVNSLIHRFLFSLYTVNKTSFIVIRVASVRRCRIICNDTRLYWLIKVI